MCGLSSSLDKKCIQKEIIDLLRFQQKVETPQCLPNKLSHEKANKNLNVFDFDYDDGGSNPYRSDVTSFTLNSANAVKTIL